MVTVEKSSSMDMADRISALPEPILHHILSFLPFYEAAETSLLSKLWKRTMFSFPILEFHDIFYEDSDFTETNFKLRRWKFEQTLKKRHLKMIGLTKLRLAIDSYRYPEFIDRCVRYAIERNVKELILGPITIHNFYDLPEIVLHSKSINVLELKHYELKLKDLKLVSLRKLCLENAVFGIDDFQELTGNMFAGCPLIEHLFMAFCSGLKAIQLSDLDKLTEVVMIANKFERLEIKASCKNIKSLTLIHFSIISDEWLYNQIKNLPLLEYLNITYPYKLQRIHISSPCLKTLIIRTSDELVEAKIETPNLNIFKYECEMISFSSNGFSEVDIYINRNYLAMEKEILYSRYIKLLENFNYGGLNLGTCSIEAVIIPANLRKGGPSPLSSSVTHLNLTVDGAHSNDVSKFSIFTILDSLLWIAPHVETIEFNQPGSLSHLHRYVINKHYFQFAYYEEEFVGCCKSLPLSCWRHCIKEVNVKIHNELDEGDKGNEYSLEGEEILKKLSSILISSNRPS